MEVLRSSTNRLRQRTARSNQSPRSEGRLGNLPLVVAHFLTMKNDRRDPTDQELVVAAFFVLVATAFLCMLVTNVLQRT